MPFYLHHHAPNLRNHPGTHTETHVNLKKHTEPPRNQPWTYTGTPCTSRNQPGTLTGNRTEPLCEDIMGVITSNDGIAGIYLYLRGYIGLGVEKHVVNMWWMFGPHDWKNVENAWLEKT